jgi:hypothetical protein
MLWSRVVGATVVLGILLWGVAPARATPSTQIWIPSTDIQGFLVPHLNSDVYVRLYQEPDGTRKPPLYLFGPTIGILPYKRIQAEVGFDLIFQGFETADRYPIYFNAKLATPEDAFIKYQPAVAVGIYNAGVKSKVTNQDIVYGLVGRTFPVVGRFTGGYYWANSDLFVDSTGNKANHGVMASWDRTMKELSDKLWLAVDYQGGANFMGSVNFGFAWSFTSNVSMIFGYDYYTNRTVAGRDTFTVQLDINIERAKPAVVPASQVAVVK